MNPSINSNPSLVLPKIARNLATVLIAASLAATVHANPGEAVGKPLPPLESFGLDGQLPDTGGKVVLLDFWASWCAPCKASFPEMAGLHRDYADRGLVIVAVSVDDDPRALARFVAKASPPFATLRDKNHKLVATMGVPTMPTSFLIDRNGMIRFEHSGFHGDTTVNAYKEQIEQLLGESGP